MSDALSHIVMNLELYEDKELMAVKNDLKEYGATTATTLRLTQPYHGSGSFSDQRIKWDSFFDFFVKTAHRDFPRFLLGEPKLQCGRWVDCSTVKDEIKLQACQFKDLNLKDFISTCSTSAPGNPRVTCHHGLVHCQQMAESYLKYAASIDTHNHYPTGSCGIEDIWNTDKPHHQQFEGVLGLFHQQFSCI